MLFDEIAEILWKHLITAAPVASQPCKHPPPPPPEVDNKISEEIYHFPPFSLLPLKLADQNKLLTKQIFY